MPARNLIGTRTAKAVHGHKKVERDPEFEIGLSEFLTKEYSRETLADVYQRFSGGDDKFSVVMRRAIFRGIARSCGDGLMVASQVRFKHLESFEFGSGVFIGTGTFLQGRFDGTCQIGNQVWIGPQSYLDARELIIEDFVGWGPGAKVLGSQHIALPVDVPIVQTDLEIRPVHVRKWADVGTNAVILPGVTIGEGSIVGAGAVVTKDVPPFAVVAGVPARFLRWRDKGKSQSAENGRPVQSPSIDLK